MVRRPTADPISRWLCSYKIPPTIRDQGYRNMLYPKVVGQSGTAKPEPVLVTNPPTNSRGKVATVVSRARR